MAPTLTLWGVLKKLAISVYFCIILIFVCFLVSGMSLSQKRVLEKVVREVFSI